MLNRTDVNTIYNAALDAGLANPEARTATLAWLPKDAAAMLPIKHQPALQLRSDITTLVMWHRDGLKLLDVWLDSAIGVAESLRPISPKVLVEMLERVSSLAPNAPEGSAPNPDAIEALMRLIFIAASPRGTPTLSIPREIDEIRRIILNAPRRERFELSEMLLAARPDDLRQTIERSPGNVLHISAHGLADGSLILEGPTGGQEEFNKAAFVNMITLVNSERTADKRIRMVVLNACASHALAKALVSDPKTQVEVAVGTEIAIDDAAAVKFAQGFYSAIASSKSVGYAVEAGRQAVQNAGPGLSANASAFQTHAAAGADPHKIWLIPT